MDKKIDFIKVILEELIVRLRKEEKFLKSINEINELYEVNFSQKEENPFYRILGIIGMNDEEEVEEISEQFLQANKEVAVLVEDFCEKYF